jgi:hypothetical protein
MMGGLVGLLVLEVFESSLESPKTVDYLAICRLLRIPGLKVACMAPQIKGDQKNIEHCW